MFYITFRSYGSIELTKEALQNFPSSLISQTFLGGDTVNEDNKLYVPIGCGLRSFPALIQEIYDGGFVSKIPEQGLEFDLFVKWLRYLGLATAGRSLSTETDAAKTVSYFVEMFIDTVKLEGKFFVRDGGVSRLSAKSLVCVDLQPDIARYRHNLLPFEFARRGIHMALQQRGKARSEEGDDLRVRDLSTIRFGKTAQGDFAEEGFCLPHSRASVPQDTVLKSTRCQLQGNEAHFSHNGSAYCLSIEVGLDEDLSSAKLVRVGAGCSYNSDVGSENLLWLSDPDILVEDGQMYDSDVHGCSCLSEEGTVSTVISEARVYPLHTYKEMPFVHGMMAFTVIVKDQLRCNPLLLVVASEEQSILAFRSIQFADWKGAPADIWEFTIDESPEWALCTEGAAP